jgi:hypothetical protein
MCSPVFFEAGAVDTFARVRVCLEAAGFDIGAALVADPVLVIIHAP